MLPSSPKQFLTLLVLSVVLFSGATFADAYSDARAELIAAYQAEDFAAMQVAADKALDARPGYPGALFNLAFAKSLAGDSDGSLDILNSLAQSGVDYGVAEIEEFAALKSLPSWQAYTEQVAALNEPVGDASIVFSYDAGDFVPEGIVAVGDELILGSIRNGSIVRIGEQVEVLSESESAGHWSVFGMRAGPDGDLWFGSAAVPEFASVTEETSGATGLFRLDPETKKITARTLLPKLEQAMVLGDLVFADDDTIYATESLTGALYRYVISADKMTQVIAPGKLRSMQGLVLDANGTHLYISDYVGGLFRIQLSDFSVTRVMADPSVSLFGIDGLYRHGNELIAIQNGIRPNRVAGFKLSEDGTSITESRVIARNLPEFDEPTLGTIVGEEFLFIANSHWNRFDRDGNLAEGLDGPIILKIKL
jgi:sugar lactone lactonase YvrE